jgi:NAD(P)H dehydrogenase (quinone)
VQVRQADYAAAAAAVLTGEGQEDTVYELSGDTAWSLPELAATASELSGRSIVYRDLSAEDYGQALLGAGIPEFMVPFMVETHLAVADGVFAETTGDLSRLIGRPTTPLRDTLSALLGGN